jgi:hypothetical protein
MLTDHPAVSEIAKFSFQGNEAKWPLRIAAYTFIVLSLEFTNALRLIRVLFDSGNLNSEPDAIFFKVTKNK